MKLFFCLLLLIAQTAAAGVPPREERLEFEANWPPYPWGVPQSVAVQGDYAYAAFSDSREGEHGSVRVYDVRDPAAPILRGWTAMRGQGRKVALQGSSLLAANAVSGLEIFDISDPDSPQARGFQSIPTQRAGVSFEVSDVGVWKDVAVVLAGDLYLVDVSDPASPQFLSEISLGYSGGMCVADGLVYVCGTYEFAIVDIHNPRKPILISRPRLNALNNESSWAVAVSDGFAYLAGSSLFVFDVRDPAAPKRVGQAGFNFGYSPLDIAIFNQHALLSNGFVFDISDPAAPRTTSSSAMDRGDIAITDDKAYVAGSSGIGIFPLAPSPPELKLAAGTFAEPLGPVLAVARHEHYAFALVQRFQNSATDLVVLDTANPAIPAEIARIKNVASAKTLRISGTNLFAGLNVWDISNPAAPRFVADSRFGDVAVIAFSGDFIYAAQGTALHSLARSHATDMGGWYVTLETGLNLMSLTLSGDTVFAAGTADGIGNEIIVIDVTNPLAPSEIVRFSSAVAPSAVAVNGHYCYALGNGMEVFDISNVRAPVSKGVFYRYRNFDVTRVIDDWAQIAPDTAGVSGGYLYALQVDGQLASFDLRNPEVPALASALDLGHAEVLMLGEGGILVGNNQSGIAFVKTVETPPGPPRFTSPLANRSALAGAGTELVAEASGAGPLTYAWFKDGLRLSEDSRVSAAARPVLAITSAQPADAGEYSLVVQNEFGAATSGPVTLRIVSPLQIEPLTTWPGIPSDFPPGRFWGLTVQDHTAYVTTIPPGGSGSLQIFEIGDPANPRRLGGLAGTGWTAITVSGGNAFIGDYDRHSVTMLDVTDPAAPKLAGRFELAGDQGAEPVLSVAARGRIVCAAAWYSGLNIIDFSDPNAPLLIARTNVLGYGDEKALIWAGNFLYAKSSLPDTSLKIFDLTDPAAPKLAAVYQPAAGFQLSSMDVSDNYVWLAGNGIEVIDASNPSHPFLVSRFSTDRASSISVSGKIAAITTAKGLQIVDFSNFAAPAARGAMGPIEDNPQALSAHVKLAGDSACVVHDSVLDVIDLSDPDLPAKSGSLSRPAAGVSGVWTSGQTALLAETKGAFRILDLSHPESPRPLATIPAEGVPEAVQFAGDKAYFLDAGKLKIANLDNPPAPFIERELGTGSDKTIYQSFALYQGYALLSEWPSEWTADGSQSKLRIVSLADPSAPVATLDFECYQIVIHGNDAYVSNGREIRIFDLTNPFAPVQAGSVPLDSTGPFLVSGHYLYAATGSCRGFCSFLSIFDIQNPAEPLFVRQLQLDPVSAMLVKDDRLYLTGSSVWFGGGPVNILDLSTPDDLVLVGRLDTPEGALSGAPAFAGDTLLVADSAWGLRVVRLTEELSLGCLKTSTGLQLSWPATPGRHYQIQSCDSFPAIAWRNEGAPLTASGNIVETNLSNLPAAGMRFYRIQMAP